MLPALKSDRLSLADVFPSCLAALAGESNRMGLPSVSTAVVVLVDGLGAAALKARAGHARTLVGAMAMIDSGFPTTTASALATLTTGVRPGQHGLVGYSVLDADNDRIVRQLSDWDDRMDPRAWQQQPTAFEQARDAGWRPTVISPSRYADSGFTRAVLRGADFLPAQGIADRFDAAASLVSTKGSKQLVYVYVPELDSIAHASGWESGEWTRALELVDSSVRQFTQGLGSGVGVLVTADHGVIDIPASSHIVYDESPELMLGVRHVGGEPRCLQLYFDPEASAQQRADTVAAWHESEDDRSWVLSRDEAIAADWFGEVTPEARPRIGDLIVAARKGIAYYSVSSSPRARAMVGQHGSWSPAEVQVPLLRYGAFAA